MHGRCTGGDPALLLRTARDILRDAPHELTATYMDVPAMDPSAPAGASLVAVWAGDDEAALRGVLAPVAALPGVASEVTTPAYRDILMEMPQPEDPDQLPPAFIGGNGLFAELDDALIDRLVVFRAKYPVSVVFLRSLGGAYADRPQENTPFPARDARWFVMAGGFDVPGLVDDDTRAAIAADWAQIAQGRLAVYGNFVTDVSSESVPAMYTPAAYARLREIKATWDPQNVFHRNHNVV